MGHMINRQSQAFPCNLGNNCTRNRLNCTRLRLVQLAVACAIIPELHSKACDYLYEFALIINVSQYMCNVLLKLFQG